MSDRIKINEDQLDAVNGGKITYTWNGETGSLGMNGVNKYTLLNKDAFVSTYKELSATHSDAQIIRELRNRGIIK